MSWNIIPKRYSIGRSIWIWTSIELVKHYIKNYGKPDVLHVHCAFDAGSVALYIKRKYNIPYIITEHSTLFGLEQLSETQKSEAYEIYSQAEKVIVVSNPFKKLVSEKVGFDEEKIAVIPNFIDTDYFNPELFNDTNPKNVILTVCHLEVKKRVDRLIIAFKEILKHFPDLQLVIGGSGSQSENLRLLTEKLKLADNVIFTGFLSKQGVRDQLSTCKVFVLPSDVETFGVVVIEAMAMGVPVVATRSGGPEDILTEDSGIITDKTPESLANGIMDVLSNYERFEKQKIRDNAISFFSGTAVAEKYIGLYKRPSCNRI